MIPEVLALASREDVVKSLASTIGREREREEEVVIEGCR